MLYGVLADRSITGIMRYCWKVPDYYAAVKDIKRLGKKIYVEDQRGMHLNAIHSALEAHLLSPSLLGVGRYAMDLLWRL